jgi:F-type H+-transporting ATPase subunit epsilon
VLSLEILSPEGRVYKDSADEVIIPTVQGEIGVLPGHVALIAKLSEGEIRASSGGKAASFAVIGGFVEIRENKVSVIADYAIRSEFIESQKAEEARKRAVESLKEKTGARESANLEKDLKRAIMELKIAQKYKKKR